MSLRLKFNLILGLAGAIGLVIAALLAKSYLENSARTEVLGSARMILQSAISVRNYTTSEIKPLVGRLPVDEFHKQSVPAYAANRYIAQLREKYPEYGYKEAVKNPTNLANKTVDWEADLVDYFINNKTAKEWDFDPQTPTGKFLYLSQPITVNDQACLSCHTTPAMAPPAMIKEYGEANGFGWKLHDTIGARYVSVPMEVPLKRAASAFHKLLGVLLGIFLLVGLLLNVLLHYAVIRPVRLMAENANKVSMGELGAGELVIEGEDEIASLSQSFNRMHRSLANAIKMLDDSGA